MLPHHSGAHPCAGFSRSGHRFNKSDVGEPPDFPLDPSEAFAYPLVIAGRSGCDTPHCHIANKAEWLVHMARWGDVDGLPSHERQTAGSFEWLSYP